MGPCEAWEYHATYAALAHGMQAGDAPALVWGQPTAHLCLGQSQSAAAELTPSIEVPVLQRPLGGGAVWLDEGQCCIALVAPRDLLPQRPAQWFDPLLDAMVQVYREAGLPVVRAGRDLHCRGRKIAGSGAATLGQAGVVASSFLIDFPVASFARALACPSAGFRVWLEDALRDGLTWWRREGQAPPAVDLAGALRRATNAALGWRWMQDRLTAQEGEARQTWRAELRPEPGAGVRLVRDGVKISHGVYLTECSGAWGWVRSLTRGGRVVRLALSGADVAQDLLAGVLPRPEDIAAALAAGLHAEAARAWALRILACAHLEEDA